MISISMDIFSKIAENIIAEQESIIGPVALEQAKKVQGLSLDWKLRHVTLTGDKTQIIDNLVKQYESLFGRASIDACKEAVKNIITQVPQDQIPPLLR